MLAMNHQLIDLTGEPMDTTTPKVWAALVIRSGREQDAADWLKDARLFAYWPCYTRHENAGRYIRLARRSPRRPRFASVIPGYIFMAIRMGSDADPWDLVRQAPGIMNYLRDPTGRAATITDAHIEVIRRIEAGLNLPVAPAAAHHFKTGDRVRFTEDIYSHWAPGRVTRLDQDGQIVVDAPLLGRIVPIKVYPHQIERM